MKNILQKFTFLIMFYPFFAFADGTNILEQFTTKANEQIKGATTNLASIINTISLTIGVLWIVVMLLMLLFNMEAIKQHSKLLAGSFIVIGIIYGLSYAMM